MPKDDLVGRLFGRLTVKKFAGYPAVAPSKAQWLCDCVCGKTGILVYGYNLKNGNTNSCSCFKIERTREKNATHGMSRTKEYGMYCAMLSRCLSPSNQRYESYGERGITVCSQWMGERGFVNFLRDMGKKPGSKYSLERKNNDGPYSPENCVWATQKEQCNNKRNNVVIDYEGQQVCLKQFCDQRGLPYARVNWRLKQGWSLEKAISAPYYARA